MKRKKILLTCLLFICTALLFSKEIDYSTAEKVALNFFLERTNNFVNATNYIDLTITYSKLIDDAYYVFNFKEGWVLVSADDAMVPVLGYSYHGKFPAKKQQTENFKSWMQHYVDQLMFSKENNIESAEHKTKWKKYLTNDLEILLNNTDLDEVEPLLTGTWNQTFPYNLYCPEDSVGFGGGGHTGVGCVGTGMAQIMYYWRYPIHGTGSHTYYCPPYGVLSANFGQASYEWDAMQSNIDFNNPWEIAEISYHAAVSVETQFGPWGSSASIPMITYSLSTFFNYDTSSIYYWKVNFSQEDWEDMIREDLDLHRPLNYGGESSNGGHSFVCDGYQGTDFFHFNFGWSGYANGYYTLEDVYGFNLNQILVKNIFPADPNYPYIAEGPDTLTFLSGSFTDGSGPAEDYPSGMETSWLIDPQSETDSISNMVLTFIQFNTNPSDYLKVYDGETINAELLGEFSGDNLPEDISSSGNKMLITFSSTGTGSGFKIEYHPIYPEFCSNQQFYTEPSGTVTDGSGTFKYNNSTTCEYVIEVPAAIKYYIEFTSFSTEHDSDLVTIYNNDQIIIDEFSGSELPDLIEIETNKVELTWITNETFNDEGWSFYYTVEGTGINEKIIDNNLCIIPNPFATSTTLSYELQQPKTVFLSIYNHLGQIVYQTEVHQPQGPQKLIWNAEGCADGIYYYRLKVGDAVANGKLVKVR